MINNRSTRLPIVLGICGFMPISAHAVSFKIGEIEGQFDSSLSVGASWSTQSPDKDLWGGSGDDGRRNFDSGETFSKVFKGIHDLELKYGDSGIFMRGKYWYDFELKDESRPFKDIEESGRDPMAKASGAQLLDAFLYHNYMLMDDLAGTVRIGRQVVNWGESTFIRGGINSMNTIDVSALRQPGAEVKEGLIPVNMIYLSQTLSEEFSMDMFYQLDWEKTVVENCGTFFSQNDFVADGCGGATVGPVLDQNAFAQQALSPFGINLTGEGVEIKRAKNNEPRDDGQWGVALHWFSSALDTEFGAYAANYHSRQPYVSSISSPNTTNLAFAPQLCSNLGIPAGGCAGFLSSAAGRQLVSAYRLGTSQYYVDYPEDIRLYGLSFSTMLSTGTTLSGEVSYRPNLPLQLNSPDLTAAAVGNPATTPIYSSGAYSIRDGAPSNGYQRKEVTQAQVTGVHLFESVMGASRMTLVGEVGVTHVGGLEGRGGLRYGRASVFGQGELYPDNALCRGEYCNNSGFVTTTSWGYRARAIWEYDNLIPAVQLRPSLAWSHDVDGYGPEPGFGEGSKAVSVGLDATYRSAYNASLSYTNYFGGDYNMSADRDFVALSFGVTF
ncbi:DUF1302 domain-containing protein [Pseudomonas sp. NFACC44-2]|uniref:DUF1302 domain-containing protein n=1 Tax=unclassified Pseudomonas TaxID=196821 RepID=UPI000876829E|nr:Protein of unknown function [Pseudomonas sp. NFACC44-2]SDA89785.1 Protein of unknown function [Pseudomonas sp. NFACC51]SDW43059.1 Protein of unknown function [Pseudomonas sp. NFACC08-1]SFI16220.1 Protein of unknown function [Pseudomonas sp. NFACC54]SFT28374.1 Protein of unknown function [Pseudomonas sp. NFACC48-1]